MNKTAQTEFHRLFLIEKLPEPLTPASSHLQLFDNYLENTRIRLRKIRDPYTKSWTRVLQQRFPFDATHGTITKLAEMHLNDSEHSCFERFEGREIRKNRYFHDIDQVSVTFDIFLGSLWGLNTARVDFESFEALENYLPPPAFFIEVSNDPFFFGETLVEKSFAEVQKVVADLSQIRNQQ